MSFSKRDLEIFSLALKDQSKKLKKMVRQESEANAAGLDSNSFKELYYYQQNLIERVEAGKTNDILKTNDFETGVEVARKINQEHYSKGYGEGYHACANENMKTSFAGFNELKESLEEVLSFGTPKPDENPNMYVAWEKAHKLLAEVSSP